MATKVAGERYYEIDGQLLEIKRQLRQNGGYPFDPDLLKCALQDVIEGKFTLSAKQCLARTVLFQLMDKGRSMLVNLGMSPKLDAFDHHCINSESVSAWVKVELKKDQLYVGGNQVLLHLDESQKHGKSIAGFELIQMLSSSYAMPPNIMDALMQNKTFIPKSWYPDNENKTKCIIFWKVHFKDQEGRAYVRCMYFKEQAWKTGQIFLEDKLSSYDFAAISIS